MPSDLAQIWLAKRRIQFAVKSFYRIPGKLGQIAAGSLATGLVALFSFTSSTEARQVLQGHVPSAVSKMAPLRRLPQTNRMDVAISLPIRDQAGLDKFLADVYNPASPQYRQFCTPEQFAGRFGPTEADYEALATFAAARGLKVTKHTNRLVLSVNGSVAAIEKAFNVRLNSYRHPVENREFFAPDANPILDTDVPVLGIDALDNYRLPRPMNLKKSAFGTNPDPRIGTAPGGYLMGNDFRAAYAKNVSLTGTGQSVALVQFDGYYTNDIAQYRSLAGLPDIPLQNVMINGYSGAAGVNNAEVAMDIQMVMSMAPGLSKILVYEASMSTSWVDMLSRIANDNLARQISCSWGGGSANASGEQIFKQMAAQGQTFFTASGDSGSFLTAASFPDDSPNITIVGGTTVDLNSTSSDWQSETTWKWSSTTSSGGGISTVYTIPVWQQGISMAQNQGSTTMRNMPDVAMAADNIYVIYDNGATGIMGGTSAAAPLWGGLMALVNQQAESCGHPPVGFLAPAVYSIAKSSDYTRCFHDITTGNNANDTNPTKFYAVQGYDLCTGLGSPIGANLINMLAPPLYVATHTLIAESGVPTNGLVDPGETVTVNLAITNAGTTATLSLIATLQTNDNVLLTSAAQTYGQVLPAGAVSKPFTFTVKGNCGQVISLNLRLQDGSTFLGTITYPLQLGKIVRGTAFIENFDTATTPSLPPGWTTSSTGAQSTWTTSSQFSDSSPNAAFTAAAGTAGVNELVSPSIYINSTTAQLTFRHYYNLQLGTPTARDGGVLEIKIGSNAFADFLGAGGSFLSNGYNSSISLSRNNPLGGRQAWSGNSSSYITTVASLPSSAAGKSIQLRWRCGSDSSTSSPGWYIDNISIADDLPTCSSVTTDLSINQSLAPLRPLPGQQMAVTLTVTNSGPSAAFGVTALSYLSSDLTFISGSPGVTYSPNAVTCRADMVPAGMATNYTVVVSSSGGRMMSTASVSAATPEANNTDNASILSALVLPENLTGQPMLSDQGFSLAVNTFTNLSYSLEYKNDLSETNWTQLLPVVLGTGDRLVIPDASARQFTRFYRLRIE